MSGGPKLGDLWAGADWFNARMCCVFRGARGVSLNVNDAALTAIAGRWTKTTILFCVLFGAMRARERFVWICARALTWG